MSDLAEYIADHYGTCATSPCGCLRTGWLGRRCENWRPVAANDWDELRAAYKLAATPKNCTDGPLSG